MKLSFPLAAALALAPMVPAQAHPHVFIDVSVAVIYQDGKPVGVQLDWVYDAYFSLLLTTDLGIDADGDMVLTDAEAAILNDSITNWPEDFAGDLEVSQNDEVLTLGDRIQHSVTLVDGQVHETHIRPLPDVSDAPLTIRAFDPFFYVDYELVGPVVVSGRNDCTVDVTPPNLNDAYSLVDELLYGRPASDVGPEESFPAVGLEFSDKIVVTCAA